MTAAAAAMQAIGGVVGAVGTIVQGRQEAAASIYNARMAEREAQTAKLETAAQEERLRRDAARVKGTQQAAFAASGVTPEGSPLAALEDTAIDSELDALSARYQGAAAASKLKAQARLDRWRAGAIETQSYFQAGAQLLGGGAAAGTTLWGKK